MDTTDDRPTSPDKGDAADATSDAAAPLWAAPVRGAWALCWRRPGLWLALTIPMLIASGLQVLSYSLLFGNGRYEPGGMTGLDLQWIALPVYLVASYCGIALTVAMAGEVTSCPSDARQAFRLVISHLAAILRLGCLFGIVIGVILIVPIAWHVGGVIHWAIGGNGTPPLLRATNTNSGPLALWWWSIFLILALRFGFSLNGLLFGHMGAIASIKDSFRLTRATWGRQFGYLLLGEAPGLGLLALTWLPTMQAPYGFVATLTHAVANLITVIWSIFGTALWLLAWYRLRALKDGLTLTHFAAELNPSLPVPEPPHQRTVVARDEPRVAPTTPLRRRRRR